MTTRSVATCVETAVSSALVTATSTARLAHVTDDKNDVVNDKLWAIAHPPPGSCMYPAAQFPVHVAGVLPNTVHVLSAQALLQCVEGDGDGDSEISSTFPRIDGLGDG